MTRVAEAVHALDAALAERSARALGHRPDRDAAMAAAARHTAKLEVALLGALLLGGPGSAGRRRRAAALRTGLALLLTVGAVEALGRAIRRTRPFAVVGGPETLVRHPPHRSFPSRHSACAATMSTVALPAAPGIGWTMMALGGVLSISRVYTGLHYPSDIAAGWLIGILIGLVARRIGRTAGG